MNKKLQHNKSFVNLVKSNYTNVTLTLVNINLQLVTTNEIFGSPIVMKISCGYVEAWHVCWRVTEGNESFLFMLFLVIFSH